MRSASDVPFRLLPPDTFQVPEGAGTRRDRIWELSPNLHCSIVGTCLSTGDLRALLAKLGDADARTASDHALHGRGVNLAGCREGGGKLLQKLLDRRHDSEIRRFAKAKTIEDVRRLWHEYLDRGEIPGAYWAVLTHPATNSSLIQESFGEVHMLSHLVGRSNRVDVRRLAQLESGLSVRDATIAEQTARIQALTDERIMLVARVDTLDRHIASGKMQQPDDAARLDLARRDAACDALQQKLDRERAHRVSLEDREVALNRTVKGLIDELRSAGARLDDMRDERDSLEASLSASLDEAGARDTPQAVGEGRTILYVGGRPQTVVRLAALVTTRGGTLLSHDGGVEDNPALLAGLISRAELVLFPVDCVSHDAAGHIKRVCRDGGRTFRPLRSASLAAAVAALEADPPSAVQV